MHEHLEREAEERDFLREQLEKDTALMRRLGVRQWHNVTLGDPPIPDAVDSEPKTDANEIVKATKRAKYENLLNRVVGDDELERLPE